MFRAGVSAYPNHSSYTHRALFCAMFVFYDVLACLFFDRFLQIAENPFALLISMGILRNAGWPSLVSHPIFALRTWAFCHPSRGVYARNRSIRASSPRLRDGHNSDLHKNLASLPIRRGASAVLKTIPRSILRHQHNLKNNSLNLSWEPACYNLSYKYIVLRAIHAPLNSGA